MREQPGYTLIESLVAMTLCATVLTTIASTMYALRQSERGLRMAMESDRATSRFANRFRLDAHLATAATIDGRAPTILRLTYPRGRRIEYRLTEAGIERLATSPDKTGQRELYRLPAPPVWQWSISTEPALVALLIDRGVVKSGSASIQQRIEATLGVVPVIETGTGDL